MGLTIPETIRVALSFYESREVATLRLSRSRCNELREAVVLHDCGSVARSTRWTTIASDAGRAPLELQRAPVVGESRRLLEAHT
jgi:hypothetical protein